MSDGWSYVQTRIYMDTLVTIEIPLPGDCDRAAGLVENAFGWFAEVERVCNRFDGASELRRLCETAGRPVPVTPLLLRAIEMSLEVARDSGGAFDPTVGAAMEARGFNRSYLTGTAGSSGIAVSDTTYRDVILDPVAGTVMLRQPLLLDLGAIAKGFAIDLAGAELAPLGNFAINAGGDVLVRGRNAAGAPWQVGVKDARRPDQLLSVVSLTEGAVCTSGDYERRTESGHHLLEPGSQAPAASLASVTVVAPSAMLADALSTAAFVLGAENASQFLQRQGVEGLMFTSDGRLISTPGLATYLA
ncbi:MAG TPA: FAD:protein FMN transferase [Dehalococcoidia bacterium]|nr:FAD:protein FMN transferase [Dehalococcoidia bacterium]